MEDIAEMHDLQSLPKELQDKYYTLTELLKSYKSVILGYSGGVDSVFLAYVCHQVLGKDNYTACIAVSASLAKREYEDAVKHAKAFGINLEIFESTEMENPEFIRNDADRCFHCKSDLFKHLGKFRDKSGFSTLLYGGNLDDLGDYRPGHQAADKYNAKAPMALAKLKKSDIRILSKHFNLPTFSKPSMPCLSSRVPYGIPVTPENLKKVERSEDILAGMGFSNFRVRCDEDTARIEIPLNEFPKLNDLDTINELTKGVKDAGFKKVVLDLEGLRSGNLNDAILKEK